MIQNFSILLLKRWRCDRFKTFKEFNVDRIRLNTGTQCDAEIRLKLNDNMYIYLRWSYVEYTTAIVKQRKVMKKNYAKYIRQWNFLLKLQRKQRKKNVAIQRSARVHKCYIQNEERIKKEKYKSSIEAAKWMCDVYGTCIITTYNNSVQWRKYFPKTYLLLTTIHRRLTFVFVFRFFCCLSSLLFSLCRNFISSGT